MSWLPDMPLNLLILLGATALVGGIVRGFAGFGAGLIFMPVASSLIDPRLAAASFLILDFVLTLPLAVRAVRICDWPTVLPVTVASILAIPVGAYILAHGDVLALRWAISILALGLLGLLASGWRYRKRPHVAASLGVGAAAGLLGGLAQISGPPVVAYWMSGPAPAAIIRANLITFFLLASFGSFTAYWLNGFYTGRTVGLLVLLVPVYAFAIWLGAHLFKGASERGFRRVAYGLIAVAAISSLPVLDAWLR